MSEIATYSPDGIEGFSVLIEDETVWLTQAQMVTLFERDRTVITKHINNVFKESELDEQSNVHFLHIANSDKPIKLYNLDVIISVGYRVKSQRGTQFRRWATKVLRNHLLNGYTIKQPVSVEQLNELHIQIGEILQRQNNADLRMHDVQKEFGKVYEILNGITEQLKLQEEKPRLEIGFGRYIKENQLKA